MPTQRPTGGSWKASSGSPSGGASRMKKIAKSPAAKDAKKVAKIGAVGVAAKTIVDKTNKKMDADQKRYMELMRKYKNSAAYGNISFEKWLKMGGGK